MSKTVAMSKLFRKIIKKLAPTFKTQDEGEPETMVIPIKKNKVEIIKVTDRLFTMPFPTKERIGPLSQYLNTKFGDKYMIYNISEHQYPTEPFNNQVIEYIFGGYPCASLEGLFMMCKEIQVWLNTEPSYIAIIHCQASRSRSCMLIAALLTLNSDEYYHPAEALNAFCDVCHLETKSILFPSQARYLNYFGDILNGFVPKYTPLLLESVVFHGVPNMETYMSKQERLWEGGKQVHCKPYIQLFKNGNFIFSSLDTGTESLFGDESSCTFKIGIVAENDVLLRCRHFHDSERRMSMFRIYFHTSYITQNYIRFGKKQIDGADKNPNYPEDFYIDLQFTPIPKVEEENVETNSIENKDEYWDSVALMCTAQRANKKPPSYEIQLSEEGESTENSASPMDFFVIDNPETEEEEVKAVLPIGVTPPIQTETETTISKSPDPGSGDPKSPDPKSPDPGYPDPHIPPNEDNSNIEEKKERVDANGDTEEVGSSGNRNTDIERKWTGTGTSGDEESAEEEEGEIEDFEEYIKKLEQQAPVK